MKYLLLLTFISGLLSMSAQAKIKIEKVEYSSEGKTFEGLLAYDTAIKEKKAGVVVFHNWMGITAETESKITELAKLGMVAFAGDIYGKDIRPKNTKEAGELATLYKNDRKLLRERVNLALAELKKNKNVETKKLFATGYCFGGTAALELGRSGAELKGIVSFHGGLSNPTPFDAKNIKAEVLVFHGGIDPYVSSEEVEAFKKEMDEAKVTYQFTSFSKTVHSFTEKAAGDDITKGAAYNALADTRSWQGMKNFFSELTSKTN
jgi:dienelactone hydrolase